MFLRSFLVALFGLWLSGFWLSGFWPIAKAEACRFEARPFEENEKQAATIFIGTVRTVENGLATFHVEKGIRNIGDGEEFSTEIGGSSCDLRVRPGQRWLYLGASAPAGSLMLQTEYGQANAANAALVEKKYGAAALAGGDTIGGTVEASCAPWDGAAFNITLQNGVSAMVYAHLPDGLPAPATFPSDGEMKAGHGSIMHCPRPDPDKPNNLPCRSMVPGTIALGGVTADEVTGYIETTEGEHHSRSVFRVKRVRNTAFCG